MNTTTTDVFLQSIWAKQQRISSFSSSKKQKRKNKDGITDVFLQSIWAKQQRISSFLSSKKQKRENKNSVSCIE